MLSRLLMGLAGVASLVTAAALLSWWHLSRSRARHFARRVDALWPDSRSGERDWIAQYLEALEADEDNTAFPTAGAPDDCGALSSVPATRPTSG